MNPVTDPVAERRSDIHTLNFARLRRPALLALAVLLVPLALASAVSVAFHHAAAVNARYAVAMSQIVESMARLDGHVARIEAGRASDRTVSDAAFIEALGLYGAVRAADPDGNDILENSVSDRRDALTDVTAAAGVDPMAISRDLGLLDYEMPEMLEEVWEEEEEDDWGSIDSDSPSLEASFAARLLAAAPIFADGDRSATAIDRYWAASAGVSQRELAEISAVLQRASTVAGQMPIAMSVAVFAIGLAAALFAWLFVVRPLIGRVLKTQAALEREAMAARRADRAKTEFLSTVSHELRTPMNGIIGAMQIIDRSDISEENRELIEIVTTCADHQMAMIEEILSFGEVEAGALSIVRGPLVVSKLMSDATDLAVVSAANKGIAFDVTPAEGAPRIIGDAKRLRQVIVNLVGNAVKFTEDGSVSVRAAVLEEDGSGDALFRVTVTDTGPGITDGDRTRIFERFTQGDGSATRRAGGTGLGLAIARDIAREMGGDVTLESDVGRGSTFTLLVPARIVAATGETSGEKVAA